MYEYKAKVLRVQDAGFFVDLQIDLGFGVFKKQEIELEGLVAIHPTTEREKIAREKLAVLLSSTDNNVVVKVRKDGFETYVGELFVSGASVNMSIAEYLTRAVA